MDLVYCERAGNWDGCSSGLVTNRASLQVGSSLWGPSSGRVALLSIIKSSNLRPEFKAATSHLGCFPRPDHFCVGWEGFQYFG